ncbi:MAG: PD40 domain-containing protein [Acidimicrobiia bacterium]|nr:PD40 domain-containing protein [Acidimicrobiia bacterium]
MLITVDGRDLVALELASGDAVVLARGDELSDALGLTEGRFDDVDLSPDGVTVAFTFGGSIRDRLAYGLYEVPADGSAPPQRVSLDGGDAYVSSPRYSPDGRFLAVNSGGGLLVLDEGRNTTGEGIQMAYAPLHVTWAPDGDALVWLVHFERTDCCTRQSVSIDPATGQMTNEPIREPTDGSPYFDADGDLRSMPTRFSFDVDHSGRFVVASDGTPGQLLWWEINGDDPVPRPLPVDLDLTEAPPVAW